MVLCIAHLGEQVEAHVQDGARFGVQVRYAHEGETLLGTGGALRAALPLLGETFLVTYGDSYLPFDYASPLRLLEAHDDCDGVMSAYRNEGKWDSSNVKTDGTWIVAYEKGTVDPAFDFIDYGAIALRRAVVAALPAGQTQGLDRVQSELARAHRLRAVIAERRFFEIGSPEGLDALHAELRAQEGPTELDADEETAKKAPGNPDQP